MIYVISYCADVEQLIALSIFVVTCRYFLLIKGNRANKIIPTNCYVVERNKKDPVKIC